MTELQRYMLECNNILRDRDDFDQQRQSQCDWDQRMRRVANAAAEETPEDIAKEKKRWEDLRLLADQMDKAREARRSKA